MQKTAISHCMALRKQRWLKKTLLVMRLIVILLTAGLLQVHAHGISQTVTLKAENISILKIFSAIEQQTGYTVVGDKSLIEKGKNVSLNVVNMNLKDFLEIVLKEQPFNYEINVNTIIISRKTNVSPPLPLFDEQIPIDQSIVLTGIIKSESGELLSGVSVRVRKTNIGTTTDSYGGFQLKQVSENSVIEISIIGYESAEFTVVKSGGQFKLSSNNQVAVVIDNASNPGSIHIQLSLKKSLSLLDETQIIAYGKTSRRYSTGSVGTVKAEDIERQPVMNVLQALEGRVPGLVLTPQTGNSAAPIKVEIRGRNSLNPNALSEPLYVIDGIPQGTLNVGPLSNPGINSGPVQAGRTNTNGESPLLFLNPRDIESVDVLKDADATAIYGARGANGVILITTKQSKPGPTSFNITVGKGKTTIPRKLDLMNTEEYLAVRREALLNDGIQPDIYNAPDLMLWDQNRYTDWQDYFFAPGEVLTIDAGVSGGIAQTNYRLSASYDSQEELMNQGGKTIRGSFAGNLTHRSLDQKFQFTFSSRLSIHDVNAVPPQNYIFTPPNAPEIYNEKGDFNFEPYRGLTGSNFPFGYLKKWSESKTNTINNSLKLSYEIIKGLTVSTTAGYNFQRNDNAYFTPAASSDPAFGNLSQTFFGSSSNNNWTVVPQLEYTGLVGGKGSLSVQLGGSLQHVQNEGLTTFALGFPNDNLIRSPNNASFKEVMEGSGEYRYVAAFAILNYRWDDKYIINLNGRRDGSSKFGPGKQFGDFGSVGLAWIASNENWMKSLLPSWFTFVKFRGSYGITGSDAIGDYEYLTRWSNALNPSNSLPMYSYNGTTAFNLLYPVNPDFRWASTNKLEVSATLGFLQDRINVEAAYYSNRSGNQLTMIGTPEYTGFSSINANWQALVENAGVEVSVSARLIQTKEWNLSASFNIGKNTNKLIDFPGLESSAYADQYTIGQSLNARYLFHYLGINPATGNVVLEDHNKDGQLSFFSSVVPKSPQDDRYIVYDLNPDFVGGFGTQAGYKGFAIHAQFTFKKQIAEDPYYSLQVGRMNNVYLPKEVAENHWRKAGDNALYPKYTSLILNNSLRDSDRYYTDASFLKLSNVSLSYDIPRKVLNKLKIKSCRFSVTTQNLLTITSFQGIGPEINGISGTPVTRTISSKLMFTF